MAKVRKTGSHSGSGYRQRGTTHRGRPASWLPYGIGAAVVLVVVFALSRGLQASTSGKGPRDHEWMAGVSGYPYDAGPTDYLYPDPAGLGGGRQWLPALGREDAPVTVIEVSDILCSHCRDFNLNALPGILEDYVVPGEVRYVSHYFGFNSSIQQGAGLAEMCAADQGRYFEFRHALFQTIAVGDFDIDRAARMARLDADAFRVCRSDQRYAAAVQEMAFVDNMGVRATPTFFVNGQMISGNVPNEIRKMIDEALIASSE